MTTITIESIRRDRNSGRIAQERITDGLRAWASSQADLRLTLEEVETLAECRVDADRFPQYLGAFSGRAVVRLRRKVRTKMGVAFERGDLTIARWEPADERFGIPAGWVAFSFRNGIDTSVGLNADEFDVFRVSN